MIWARRYLYGMNDRAAGAVYHAAAYAAVWMEKSAFTASDIYHPELFAWNFFPIAYTCHQAPDAEYADQHYFTALSR